MKQKGKMQKTGHALSPATVGWFIPEEELNLYDEVGLFQDETDWQDFVKERKARSLDYARPMNLNRWQLVRQQGMLCATFSKACQHQPARDTGPLPFNR